MEGFKSKFDPQDILLSQGPQKINSGICSLLVPGHPPYAKVYKKPLKILEKLVIIN